MIWHACWSLETNENKHHSPALTDFHAVCEHIKEKDNVGGAAEGQAQIGAARIATAVEAEARRP